MVFRGFVKPECGAAIYRYLHRPDLYDAVRPVRGARDAVRRLRGAGYTVRFLTACTRPGAIAKRDWLLRHGFLSDGWQARGSLIVKWDDEDPAPREIGGARVVSCKGEVAGDLLIDDHVENLRATKVPGLLFHHPHNAQVQGFPRIHDWDEGVREIMRRLPTP